MKCFYHDDADGKCSAYWVRKSLRLRDGELPEFFPVDYAKPFPFEKIEDDERVYIVDYSISPEEMTRLLGITKDVTWIDHHKTAIEKYEGFNVAIAGIRYDGIAACLLTFAYLNHMTDGGNGDIKPFNPFITEYAPLFTKLIADNDVWKFEYGNDTKYFMTAFTAYDGLQKSLWEWLDSPDDVGAKDLINDGKGMMTFRDSWAKSYCEAKGFEATLEDRRCFAMNIGLCNMDYFKSVGDKGYEILISFCFDGSKWTVSLYSETVDVSEIAKKYGGGGHKGASGFQCDILPFTKV